MPRRSPVGSLALANITKRLQGRFRIDKIYLIDEDLYSFKIYKFGVGTEEWAYKLGEWLCRTTYNLPKPETPPPKILALRRAIDGLIIDNVFQKGLEKIIVFEGVIPNKEEKVRIILEMFGDGNLVVEKDDKIIYAHSYGAWRHREIKLGIPYMFPPERPNIREMTFQQFLELSRKSSRDLVRFLAVDLGLGGEIAEEACLRAHVDKLVKASEIREDELLKVFDEIKKMIKEAEESSVTFVYEKEGVIFSVSPIRLKTYLTRGDIAERKYEDIHKAIEELLLKPLITKEKDVKEIKEEIMAKYKVILEQQQKALENLIKKSKEYRKIADRAYEFYSDLENAFNIILKAFRENRIEVLNKAREMGILEELNTRGNYVKIRIPKAGISVRLYLDRSIHESLGEYYSKAKDYEERARRLEKTIEEIKEKMIRELESKKTVEVTKKKRTRTFWFEKYKWFISSSGFIVVAGRDAKTNEEVVRRHLSDKDLYVHADIHGAPSVIIKSEGKKVDENTIKEAAEFAVFHSRAWGRVYSADAYWVYPHQVTKTPSPGEYLPLGAFVIKGRKNYIHGLETKCAVGLVNVEGYEKLMCGPVSAVKSHSNDYLVIIPGKIRKDVFATEVARAYGFDTSYVLSILPPGDIDIIEYHGERAKKLWEKLKGAEE